MPRQPIVSYYESSPDQWTVDPIHEGEEPKLADGKYIIGVTRGPFFCVDADSLNGRHYTHEFWESVLQRQEIKQRLDDRLMFGRIGHEDREVTEQDLNEGAVSHVMSRLWIDPNKTDPKTGKPLGMGEALILGTPAGHNLYTYLKAKCRLKTSSRGAGSYKEGVPAGGVPVVDENNYILETFDFVMRPGFPQTDPQLTESHNPPANQNPMDTTLLQSLSESRDKLQAQVLTLLDEARQHTAEITRLKVFEGQATKHAALIKLAEDGDIDPGSVEKINKCMDDLGIKSMDEFVDFIQKISKATAQVITASDAPPTGGDDMSASDVGEQLLKYRAIGGTPEEIEEICTRANKIIEAYQAIGSPQAIISTLKKANEALRRYIQLGGDHAKLETLVKDYRKLTAKHQANEVDEAAQRLSKEHGHDLALTRRIITASKSIDEAAKVLKDLPKGGRRLGEDTPSGSDEDTRRDDPDWVPEAIAGSRPARFFESVMPRPSRKPNQSESQQLAAR